MGSSLLTLVQNACAELALQQPGVVAGATDLQTQQMFALMNAVGADLLSRASWTALQVQAVINVEAPLTGTGNTTDGSTALTNILGVGGLASIDTPSNYLVSSNAIPTNARLTQRTVAIPASATMDMQATGGTVDAAMVFSRDTYDVPADFVTFINDTQWDNGNHWRLQGPSSPQEDAWMRNGIVTTGPRRWFRQVGRGVDVFRLWPPPGANDVPGPLVYQYLSRYWASAAAVATASGTVATPKAAFTADDDTCIYDDRLMIEGLKWRWMSIKGFDFSTSYSLWQRQVDTAIARDGGAPILNMARKRFPILISPYNAPDANFPGRP